MLALLKFTNTLGIYENESLINIPKTSTPEIKARLISLENKENSLLSPISPAGKYKNMHC